MKAQLQDRYWDRPGRASRPMRMENHFGGVSMRCFSIRPASVDEFFRATVARRPGHAALVELGRRMSYAELDAWVDRLAGALQSRGIAQGDRVVLLMGNRMAFLALVLACARIAAVSVPVGVRQSRDELEHVLNDSGASALFYDDGLAASVPAAQRTPTVRFRVTLEKNCPDSFEAFERNPAPVRPQQIDEEDTAVLLYTSGTTGRPKGAMLTGLGLVHSVMHFADCFDLDENDRTMLAVPCTHVTGLVSLLLTTVYVGGTTVLMAAFRAQDFLRLAHEEQITYSLMVPAMYLLCLREENLGSFDLSSWRVGGFGGSPMPQSALTAIARKLPSLRLQNAYGATETTSPTSLMPAACGMDHLDSVGQVVPCGEVKIVDAQGCEVADDQPGELWVRGPMVVPGYWNNPQANARGFADGFWKSGDVGSRDAQGFVKVFDRLKDMINRGGYKIFSAEVENVLAQHPDVVESAVVSRPCPVLYERVCAVVSVRSPQVTAEALRSYCAQRLADYKVPEWIELRMEPLPRNANGKIQKNELRAALAQQFSHNDRRQA